MTDSSVTPNQDQIKVYFNCGASFDTAYVLRQVRPGETPLHVAIRESISGPRSSEATVGLVAGFDPNTRATTKQQGDTVTLDLDSSTFNAAPWTEVTGGVSAIKPLQKTLSEINPTWSLEVLMDGIRLCEFAEGVICDE